jgi:hypothetical protein
VDPRLVAGVSDSIRKDAGEVFAAEVTNFPASLAAGVVGVRIIHVASGLEVTPRITSVVETPAASGSYIAALTAPTLPGSYSIFWDWCNGGPLIPSRTADEGLEVSLPIITGTTGVQPTAPDGAGGPVSVPHFSMPFRFHAGAAVVAQQDTIVEISDCVANICRYQPGDRPEKPGFGVPDQSFVEGGADAQLLTAAVARFEPRAALAATADGSELEELVSTIALTVTDKGAA